MGKRKQVLVFAVFLLLMPCRIVSGHQHHGFNAEADRARAVDGPIAASSCPADPIQTPKIAYYITRGGYIAATNESLLNRAILLALSKDRIAFARFIRTNPNVFPLKKGLEVLLEKTVRPGKIMIRPRNIDITIWTVQEAIE